MIAVVYPQLKGIGGIARYIDSFVSNIDSAFVYVIYSAEDDYVSENPRVRPINLNIGEGRFALIRFGIESKKVVERLYASGEIVWANYHWPPLVNGVFISSLVPALLTSHTTYFGMSGLFYKKEYYRSSWSWFGVRIRMYLERLVLRKVRKVVALTEQGKRELEEYGCGLPIRVIPNGVDVAIFSPGFNSEKKFDVVFSGRIEPRKGSRSMVKLIFELCHRRPDIRVCIVGYGEDYLFVKSALAGLEENVFFAGKVSFSEMLGFYHSSKIYVSTAYYEGLPGTCLEAMACGLPAVVWDFDFYKGLVFDSVNGFVIDPDDYSSAARRVGELLDSATTQNDFGRSAVEHVRNNYSWSRLSVDILSYLKES